MTDGLIAGVTGARVALVRADNPSVMTLAGTNTWIAEAAGAVWVIDPGPDDDAHLSNVEVVARDLGEPVGVALTHDHMDHSEGVAAMRTRLGGVQLLSFAERPDSPFGVVETPGHAADHLVFTIGNALFSGDLILGQSSTIVPPGGGTLIAYLESLQKIIDLAPELILPGHGDPITDPVEAVVGQREHRLKRERDLEAALADHLYDREALLDRVWSDVPAELRIAAHVTMQTNLEKLDLEGKLPDDFETEGRKSWQHRG